MSRSGSFRFSRRRLSESRDGDLTPLVANAFAPDRPVPTATARGLKLSDPESVRQRTNTFGTGLPKSSRTRSTSSKSATSATGPDSSTFTASSLVGAAASTRMSSGKETCGVPDVCTFRMKWPDSVITGSVMVATPFVSVTVDSEIGDSIAASTITCEFATGLSKASISLTLTLEGVPATIALSVPSTASNRCAGPATMSTGTVKLREPLAIKMDVRPAGPNELTSPSAVTRNNRGSDAWKCRRTPSIGFPAASIALATSVPLPPAVSESRAGSQINWNISAIFSGPGVRSHPATAMARITRTLQKARLRWRKCTKLPSSIS